MSIFGRDLKHYQKYTGETIGESILAFVVLVGTILAWWVVLAMVTV